MICTTLQNKTREELLAVLDEGPEMAEIRLDLCPSLSYDDITEVFSASDIPLVATCRHFSCPDWEKRLTAALEGGAAYVDVEMEAPAPECRRLRNAALSAGALLIRSFHDFDSTPPLSTLRSVYDRLKRYGADIVKIAVMARAQSDADAVLSLYDRVEDPCALVAFAMGDAGRGSRLDCLKKGSPFTYAALSEAESAAPGQWSAAEMSKAVYGDRAFVESGPVTMPSSKSFAQRAIVAAALAEGTSVLEGYSPCGDNEAALALAGALGASVSRSEDGSTLTVGGIGAGNGQVHLPSELNVGESGLLARLTIPVASAIGGGETVVAGEKTLTRRPLAGASDIMASFGVALSGNNIDGKGVSVPVTVRGRLIPGRADINGKGGSQLISGLLMALPLTEGDSRVEVLDPKSIPYMFITTDVLRRFGVKVDSEMEGDDDFIDNQDWSHCSSIRFRIPGGQRYKAARFRIEGDWSGAANFLVLGAVFGSVTLEGLDSASLQADLSILDILSLAGASISQFTPDDGPESLGAVHVQRAPLRGFDVDLNNCPDLFPIVAVLAAFCNGKSRISGLGRLAHKESDRAGAIVEMLKGMDVECRADGDVLTVDGLTLARRCLLGRLLRGGSFRSLGDHRMAMALSVASLGTRSPVEIDDTLCVAKSYPSFFDAFSSVVGNLANIKR